VSLKLPYKKYPDGQARAGFFYTATVPVNIAMTAKNSPRSKRFEAIIDSGASQCIFHASIGRAIGLEVEKGEKVFANGVQGPAQLYLHDIALYAPGGMICIRAGFSDELPIAGLLGMEGFFQNFKITFDPTALRVELERLYLA
jgi:hypothetical protein